MSYKFSPRLIQHFISPSITMMNIGNRSPEFFLLDINVVKQRMSSYRGWNVMLSFQRCKELLTYPSLQLCVCSSWNGTCTHLHRHGGLFYTYMFLHSIKNIAWSVCAYNIDWIRKQNNYLLVSGIDFICIYTSSPLKLNIFVSCKVQSIFVLI